MKVLLSTALLLLVGHAQASCTSGDGPCQAGSGNCSAAVLTAVSGGDITQAVAELSYGKYCGRYAQCQVVTNANASNPNQCESGSDGCPATPCDALDAACQTHDSCLDELVAELQIPEGQRVPIPERCQCEVKLVTTTVALGSAGPSNVSLCDAAFYNTTIPAFGKTAFQLLTSEAFLVGIPSCCVVLAKDPSTGVSLCGQDAVDQGYESDFASANATCTLALQGFDNLGIQLCGASPTAPTSAPVPLSPTMTPASMTPTGGNGGGESNAPRLISFAFSTIVLAFVVLFAFNNI